MKKLLVFISLLLVPLSSQAILLTDLLNGQSIIAGDKLFDQWEILDQSSSTFIDVDTDNIDVTALHDGGLDPGPGLHFDILNDEFLVEGDGIYAYLDFMFGFRVTVLDPALLVKDNSLYLTGATLINSSLLTSVFIEENIYADGTQADWLGDKNVEFSQLFDIQGAPTQTVKTFDSAEFTPTNSIYVTKNILVEAIDIGEFARLESFEQRFSQTTVPEPASFMLLGLGLIALRLGRKHS
jgi:hypothetical protein